MKIPQSHYRPRIAILLLMIVLPAFIISAEGTDDYIGRRFTAEFKDLLSNRKIVIEESKTTKIGTLIVFWSPECPPCLRDIPNINTLNSEYSSRGLAVIGFPQSSDPELITDTCRRFGIVWPQAYEPGPPLRKSSALAWGIDRTPLYILLDSDGLVIHYGFRDPIMMIESILVSGSSH